MRESHTKTATVSHYKRSVWRSWEYYWGKDLGRERAALIGTGLGTPSPPSSEDLCITMCKTLYDPSQGVGQNHAVDKRVEHLLASVSIGELRKA